MIKAIQNNDLDAVSYLIGKKGNNTYLDSEMMAIIATAAMQEDVRIFNYICSHCLEDLNSYTDHLQKNLLTRCTGENELLGIERLLEKGVDINGADHTGKTILHTFADESNFNAVDFLLKNGANPNTVNDQGRSPLYFAVNAPKIVKLLLEYNTDVNLGNQNPLVEAAKFYEFESFKLLFSDSNYKRDAVMELAKTLDQMKFESDKWLSFIDEHITEVDLSGVTAMGDTNLMLMSLYKNYPLLSIAIEKCNLNLDIKNDDGDSLLHILANDRQFKLIEQCVKKGADLNIMNKSGNMLHSSASNSSFFKKLVKLGVDIHAKNKQGDTPLWRALSKTSIDLTQLLIEKGVDVNIKNVQGKSYLQRLLSGQYFNTNNQVDYLLKNHFVDLSSVDDVGYTTLMSLAEYANGYAKYAVDHGVSLDNEFGGVTALMLCVESGDMESTSALMDAGAAIENSKGIHILSINKDVDIQALLQKKILEREVAEDDEFSMGL